MCFWECLAFLTDSRIDTGCYIRSWLLKAFSALALTGMRGCFSPREAGRFLSWYPSCARERLLGLLLWSAFSHSIKQQPAVWSGFVFFWGECWTDRKPKEWNMIWILNSVFIDHVHSKSESLPDAGTGTQHVLLSIPTRDRFSSLWRRT